MSDETTSGSGLVWGAVVVAAIAVGALALGRARDYDADMAVVSSEVGYSGDAPAARTYRELASKPWSTKTPWSQVIDGLPLTGGAVRGTSVASMRAERAERRAFEGAPPTVPHPIGSRDPGVCLVCHATGMAFPGGATAPPISHAELTNCIQCHVSGDPERPLDEPLADDPRVAATLGGVASGPLSERALPEAPPMVPHTTWMRERCLACHGVGGPQALRTTHPERASCLQCHAPSASHDQVIAGSGDGSL